MFMVARLMPEAVAISHTNSAIVAEAKEDAAANQHQDTGKRDGDAGSVENVRDQSFVAPEVDPDRERAGERAEERRPLRKAVAGERALSDTTRSPGPAEGA